MRERSVIRGADKHGMIERSVGRAHTDRCKQAAMGDSPTAHVTREQSAIRVTENDCETTNSTTSKRNNSTRSHTEEVVQTKIKLVASLPLTLPKLIVSPCRLRQCLYLAHPSCYRHVRPIS